MWRPLRLRLLAALLATCCGLPLSADEAPTEPAEDGSLSVDVVRERLTRLEADSPADDPTAQALIKTYRQALSELEAAAGHREALNRLILRRGQAPAEIAAIQAELQAPATPAPALPDTGLPLGELESLLAARRAERDQLDDQLRQLGQEIAELVALPVQARQRIAELRTEIETLKAAAEEGRSDPEAQAQAQATLRQARLSALQAEIQRLEQRLSNQPLALQRAQARRDLTNRQLSALQPQLSELEARVAAARARQAEQAEAQAEAVAAAAADLHPVLRNEAEENSRLSGEIRALNATLAQLGEDRLRLTRQADQLEESLEGARRRLEIAGLSDALGRILMDQRRRLQQIARLPARSLPSDDAIAEASLQQIRHTEERHRLSNLEEALETRLQDVPGELREALAPALRQLLEARRGLLDQALTADGNYLLALGELINSGQRLRQAIADYETFLASHLLWTRSVPGFDLEVLRGLGGELAWLLHPGHWLALPGLLAQDALARPIFPLALLLVLVLLGYDPRLRRQLRDCGQAVGRLPGDRYSYSIRTLGLTLLLAGSWPLLMAVLGWRLEHAAGGSAFAQALGHGLLSVAPGLVFLRLLQLMCLDGGLAARHFRWQPVTVKRLRHDTWGLILVLLPAGLLTTTASRIPADTLHYGVSRLAFLTLMLALGLFFLRLLGPRRGLLRTQLQRHRQRRWVRLYPLWLGLGLGLPLLLAGLALSGYFYTAGILSQGLVNSLWLLLSVLILREMVLRWLSLTHGRLAYQAAVERREALRQAASAQEPTAPAQASETLSSDSLEPELDWESIDSQTRKLLSTLLVMCGLVGLWWIWSGMLPAFGILSRVTLWELGGTEGSPLETITLANLALAVILTALTVTASRHLPTVLEIGVLQHTNLDAGARFTIATLTRYLIVGTGIVLVFNHLGGRWGEIQWLVAALGVGVGFGLQEIVANFISGLIILFERPIRVGDIVTVGDTTGQVSRIRIRATTITNWDRQELLVPNKEFITGRLLNWSLSDPVNRITVPVGVAYGSDIPKALRVLAEVAAANSEVLKDPAPLVSFESFGDNTLGLVLRCYLPNLDHRLRTITELHSAINQRFAEERIEIAFPQSDVHLHSDQPLQVRLLRP